MTKLLRAAALSALAALGAYAHTATAAYPDKPIKIIVPQSPGGATDAIGRLVANELSRELQASVVVENKEGAAGVIGTQGVARSAPDGYTLLMAGNTLFTTQPILRKNLPYDPLKDFDPVAQLVAGSHVMVVKPDSPFNSVGDVVRAAAAKPGKMSYGSGGAGQTVHLSAELFLLQANIKMLHVPYRGAPLALNGLLGGDVDLIFDTTPSAAPRIRSGQVKALAQTSKTRSPDLPNVPTMAEQGFPNYEVLWWTALYAPKGTPPEVLATLEQATRKVLASDAVKKKLADLGMSADFTSGSEVGKHIVRDTAEWAETIKKAGITLEP